MQRLPDRAARWLPLLFALPVLWHLLVLARVFASRMTYPMDVEWMEGAVGLRRAGAGLRPLRLPALSYRGACGGGRGGRARLRHGAGAVDRVLRGHCRRLVP